MLRSNHRGFTLVELMIVVAVVGIGGALAVVNMSEQVAEARAKADGQAMLQRIRQEHRENKERLTGMVLHATGEPIVGVNGGEAPRNVLIFQDAKDCKGYGPKRRFEFFKTTSLEVSGKGIMCWNGDGEPDDGRKIEDQTGGSYIPNTKDNPGVLPDSPPTLPEPLQAVTKAAMKIKAGIKQVDAMPIYVTQTNVTSTPPLTGGGIVHKKGELPLDESGNNGPAFE